MLRCDAKRGDSVGSWAMGVEVQYGWTVKDYIKEKGLSGEGSIRQSYTKAWSNIDPTSKLD